MVRVLSVPVTKHYALIHPTEFKHKPDAFKDVGKIHNYFKRHPYPEPYTLTELVNAFVSGKTLMLAMVSRELKQENNKNKVTSIEAFTSEWANLHRLVFQSTKLLGIDIDDEYGETDIWDVLNHFKGRVAAAYYSFSHDKPNDQGGKQNRYRLLFQFDEDITDYNVAKEIPVLFKREILKLYPRLDSGRIDTMNPKTLWHGSNRKPILIEESVILRSEKYVRMAMDSLATKKEEADKKRKAASQTFKTDSNNPATYQELVEMANTIGHIPTRVGRFKEWRNACLAIRQHEYAGHISQSEGLELFHIISGGESDESAYFKFNPNGSITIGTFIRYALDAGYKRKHKYSIALHEVKERIEIERIKVEKYITVGLAKELLNRRQRLLLDSPTGSGKTSSFMNAFKELKSEKWNYYIFCTPTIPLTEQVAEDHQVPCIIGGRRNLRKDILENVIKGERVFVTTYDKASDLVHILKDGIMYGANKPTFTLVIDEVHKFTEAYNYRKNAIDELEKLSMEAISLIGLSGTPEDILKDDFDKLILTDTGNRKSPCTDFRVFTYDTSDNGVINNHNADLMIIPVVRGILQQSKVLLFINNKDRINRVAKLLKKEGINCRTVASDSKKSTTYTGIVKKSDIDEEVEVLITTTVLADGISINNTLNWSCVVVCDGESPLFNPSTIKQISNRFRNQYRYFALYMRTPNPEFEEETRFNIEADFQYRLKVVRNHVSYLNTEFGEMPSNFIPSAIERDYGIEYRSTEESTQIGFNSQLVRHRSMKRKERYYSAYRMAFIHEVKRSIGHKLTGIFNVNDEVKKNGSDLSGLLADIVVEKEEKKLDAYELRNNFNKYFDESIYNYFSLGNEDGLRKFKQDVHPDLFTAAFNIAPLTEYEACKEIVGTVKRRADINKYIGEIEALIDIAHLEYAKKTSVTKRVYKELLSLAGESYSSKDFKDLTENKIPKKLKVAKSDVKNALKLFHSFHSRNKRERITTIQPLSVELIAKVRYKNLERNSIGDKELVSCGISVETVERSILRYIEMKSKHQQRVLYPAVHKKWGIQQPPDEIN